VASSRCHGHSSVLMPQERHELTGAGGSSRSSQCWLSRLLRRARAGARALGQQIRMQGWPYRPGAKPDLSGRSTIYRVLWSRSSEQDPRGPFTLPPQTLSEGALRPSVVNPEEYCEGDTVSSAVRDKVRAHSHGPRPGTVLTTAVSAIPAACASIRPWPVGRGQDRRSASASGGVPWLIASARHEVRG
jgi:hypothetical protein